MHIHGQEVSVIDGELAELRQRIPKVAARIAIVEDEIEDVQHALQDLEHQPEAAEREAHTREQTRAWLRQEKLRLGQREDRIRQEKANLMQLQLRFLDAKLEQSQLSKDPPSDIENGCLEKSLEEELVDCVEYEGYVRLIPPFLILLFLTALAVWFGVDLIHHQPGLTTTQKVASIGSATFTVMTVVALFVRAAMCTAEWQWTLHACYCITGWHWLKPMARHSPGLQKYHQQQQQQQQQQQEHEDESYVLDTVPSIPQPSASEAASADKYTLDRASDSPRSFDGSDFEDVKKQS